MHRGKILPRYSEHLIYLVLNEIKKQTNKQRIYNKIVLIMTGVNVDNGLKA